MITLIVAVDAENGLGLNNKMPWHLPADLAHFKSTTMGKPVIMGRKTYESIGRPLPWRFNAVISRNKDLKIEGCAVFESVESVLHFFRGTREVFIIGGAQLYADTIDLVDRLIVTHIDRSFGCDAFFPMIDMGKWNEVTREEHVTEDGVGYAFVTYYSRYPKKESL